FHYCLFGLHEVKRCQIKAQTHYDIILFRSSVNFKF
ncbi:MAG: hypothetical protein ACI8ZN_001160, partial [Bacteroidia bacterium]